MDIQKLQEIKNIKYVIKKIDCGDFEIQGSTCIRTYLGHSAINYDVSDRLATELFLENRDAFIATLKIGLQQKLNKLLSEIEDDVLSLLHEVRLAK